MSTNPMANCSTVVMPTGSFFGATTRTAIESVKLVALARTSARITRPHRASDSVFQIVANPTLANPATMEYTANPMKAYITTLFNVTRVSCSTSGTSTSSGGGGLLAEVLDLQLLVLGVGAHAVECCCLQQGQHRSQGVITERLAGRGDGAIGADAHRRHHERRGHVLLELVVARMDRRVTEPRHAQTAGGIEPEVGGVDRPVADAGAVQLVEFTPDGAEEVVSDLVEGHIGQRVVGQVGDEHRVVQRRHPDGDQRWDGNAVLIGEEHCQRLMFDLLTTVRPVLCAVVLIPRFLPPPAESASGPRVASQHRDEECLTVGRGA